MSYETVEASLKDVLQGVTNLGIWLDDGTKAVSGTSRVAILRYGGFTQERHSMRGEHKITWIINIELMCRYTNDKDVRNALRDTRFSIISEVNQWPHLSGNDTIFDAFITKGEKNGEIVQIGGLQYLTENLVCEIQELVDVSYQE